MSPTNSVSTLRLRGNLPSLTILQPDLFSGTSNLRPETQKVSILRTFDSLLDNSYNVSPMTPASWIWTDQNAFSQHKSLLPRLNVSRSSTNQTECIRYLSSPDIPKNFRTCWRIGTLVDTTVSNDGRLPGVGVSILLLFYYNNNYFE